jgi:Fe-S cluster biogenesis protein NfuA
MDDLQAREQVARIDVLLDELEGFADPAARETATELVAALLDLYGEGLSRLVERVPDPGALAGDELVSHLLLLHGMHPRPLEGRVQEALAEVRPYLDSHGGDVELLTVDEDLVRLRMQGSCSGCPSSAVTLKLAIEEAIRKHAPEIDRIEAEEGDPEPAGPALIQLAPLEPIDRLNCPAAGA